MEDDFSKYQDLTNKSSALSGASSALDALSKSLSNQNIHIALQGLEALSKACQPLPPAKLMSDTARAVLNTMASSVPSASVLGTACSALSKLAASTPDYSTILKASTEAISALAEQDFYEETDDYVTVDESSFREFEVPDSIAIPAGNRRVRIKTEFLVTVLLSIFFGLATMMQTKYYEQKSLESEKQYYKDQLQVKQDENQILHDFLNSIDVSESSQSDSINELVQSIEVLSEFLQSSESASQDSDSVHGQAPETLDNNYE